MTLTTRKPRKPLKAHTPLSPISKKRRAALAAAGIVNPMSTFAGALPSELTRAPRMATKPKATASKLPTLPKLVKPTGEFNGPVAAIIEDRDGHSCTRCGIGVGDQRGLDYSLQHRRARGNGGSSLFDTGLPANGIILCGSATSPHCHFEVEQRGELDEARGYWMPQMLDGKPVDPTTIPVKHALHGWVRLDNAGDFERLMAAEAADFEQAFACLEVAA